MRQTLPHIMTLSKRTETLSGHNFFKTTEDSTKLRRIAEDRDKWKELSKMICSIVILHYDIIKGNSKHDLEIKQFKKI